ncbi:MAG: membrane associated rhomboid family serine protease [Cyclobacteriaceae bacterium]|jgi:membrane associated rhomboid family serine protease
MWLMYYIQSEGSFDLGFLGILPRTFKGLIGIITGPLVHGTVQHLISNTVPLVFLGVVLFWFYPKIAYRIFWQSYVFTGMLVWIFARSFYHIGSSGFIYALGFFLVAYGLFVRDIRTILISAVVVAVYGGLFSNVFILDSRVSWESHLLGAVVGVSLALITKYLVRDATEVESEAS